MTPKVVFLCLPVILLTAFSSLAIGQDADAALKKKLLGYWGNPRHMYLYKADGVRCMCPVEPDGTTNKWDVRGGMYYEDGDAYRIVTLTDKEFSYGDSRGTYIYKRITKKQADGK